MAESTIKKHRIVQRLRRISSVVLGCVLVASVSSVWATDEDRAKRIHERLTGNIPSQTVLDQMVTRIAAGDSYGAARIAIDNEEDHSFYNVTLKNWAAPWTNRDFDAFADLNDYIATVVGYVRDSDSAPIGSDTTLRQDAVVDFRGVLYDDAVYVGDASGLPSYALDDNQHYLALEAALELDGDPGYSLKTDLARRAQSSLYPSVTSAQGFVFPSEAASGVITSRAGAKAFLIAGTNRAAFRFAMLNHLCLDMEQVHDVTRVPDRIRQDVSRSPGGDSSIFLNSCIGCHSGMDPMAQALAYHNFAVPDRANDPTGENGQIEYTPNVVQPKYFNNDATFPPGYITPDNRWANYWREGKNAVLGWDNTLPGSGTGASGMFQELAHSQAFAQCHVERVFETVCLREPTQSDLDAAGGVNDLIDGFMTGAQAGDMKHVFAASALLCEGE